jgi:hypothetical protein
VKNEVKKEDIQVVTVLFNKTPSQHFSSDSSLNFVDINSEGDFKHVFA